MDQFTLNTYSDVDVLANIFNGQAMLVNDASSLNNYWLAIVIAGFAGLFVAVVSKIANPDNKAVLRSAGMNFIAGIILVSIYTGLTARIIVQSERDGQVRAVDNVPVLSFMVPVLLSNLSIDFSKKMEAAYQPPFADYTMLSGTSNQAFGEPLRALLSTRTALLRLPQIQSDLRAIIGSCIDSSMNYAQINRLVMFAGDTANGGASSTDSIGIMELSVPTSIGALLKAAADNTSAFVVDMNPSSSATVALSCPNAVDLLNAQITSAFNSNLFSSNAVRSAANAVDRTSKTDYSFDVISNIYNNIRNFAAVTSGDAIGIANAQAELINLIFGQEIMRDLDCLKEGGSNKTTCLATASLANGIEQGNIDAAANGSAFLAGFGAFADVLFAVIIGLTPVYIIVMVFLGRNLTKMFWAYLQTMLWSVLVYNFGAVLVNSIVLYKISAGLNGLAGGSLINQADAIEAYRILSMQIGAAGSLLTSLTMLIPTLFSLSQSATMAGVASKAVAQDRFNEKGVAPDLISPSAIHKVNSVADTSITPGGATITKYVGGVDGVDAKFDLGKLGAEAQKATEQQISAENAVRSSLDRSNDFYRAISRGEGSQYGLTETQAELLRKASQEAENASRSEGNSSSVNASNTNRNSQSIGAGLSANAGVGVGGSEKGPNAGIGASASANANKSSEDSYSATQGSSINEQASASISKTKAIEDTLQKQASATTDQHQRDDITEAMKVAKSYSVSENDVQRLSTSTRQVETVGNSLVAASGSISDQQIAAATQNNPALGRVINDSAQLQGLGKNFKKHLDTQREFVDSGNMGKISGSNSEQIKHGIATFRALANYSNSEDASPSEKTQARNMLVKAASSIKGYSPSTEYSGVDPLRVNIRGASDQTGVSEGSLRERQAQFKPMPSVNASSVASEGSGLRNSVDSKMSQAQNNASAATKHDQSAANKAFGDNRGKEVGGLLKFSEERPESLAPKPSKPEKN